MSDILVYFRHPTTNEARKARVDSDMTPFEIICDLVEEGFLPSVADGYQLTFKGGTLLDTSSSLASAGVGDEDVINVLPNSRAGGLPGLKLDESDDLTIDKLHESRHTLNLIVRLYDELQTKYELLSGELEVQRLRSENRLVAALLLLISQIVLAVGANLLTQNLRIGIVVLVVGCLQACLALFLTFRKPTNLRKRAKPEDQG